MKTWAICGALVIGGDGIALIKNYIILNPRVLGLCKPPVEIFRIALYRLITSPFRNICFIQQVARS